MINLKTLDEYQMIMKNSSNDSDNIWTDWHFISFRGDSRLVLRALSDIGIIGS